MLTTIMTFDDPAEAHLFRSRLQAEGILAVVSHEHHVAVNWLASIALGGAKVQVPASEADAARAVWARCQSGEYREVLEQEFEVREPRKACPSCASRAFGQYSPLGSLAARLATLYLFGTFFPLRYSFYRCRSCGHKWSERRG